MCPLQSMPPKPINAGLISEFPSNWAIGEKSWLLSRELILLLPLLLDINAFMPYKLSVCLEGESKDSFSCEILSI